MKWLLLLAALTVLTAGAFEIGRTPPCFLDSEAPSGLQVQWQAKPRGILSNWDPHTDRAWGYRIYRLTVLPQGFGPVEMAGEVGPSATSFLDRHAHAKLTYLYLVVAFDGCGESAFYSGVVCAPASGR